jgi:N-acetyl-alpha-D-muramate 1-phosphate uridylyltransferase
MQAVILAGGLATRLRPLTEKIPKSLIEIQGKPFLEYQIDTLKAGGISDIVLCLGYLGEQIEERFGNGCKYGVNISYSYDGKKLLGTAGAIKKARDFLNKEFFIIYGDSYLILNYTEIMTWFNKKNKLGLMTVFKNYDHFDKSNVAIEGNSVKLYSKSNKTEDMIYIDYGASILTKSALDLVHENEVFPLDKLFSQLVEDNQLLAYEITKRFYEIGSFQGISEFKQYIASSGERQ